MSRVLFSTLLCTAFFANDAFAQSRQVSGIVKDAKDASPLIGVSVSVKGSVNGAITDKSGKFILSVPTKDTELVLTYVGYKSITVVVPTGSSIINLDMESLSNALEEVSVNIGYGSVKRKDLTGAISSISADVIQKAPVASALEAIAGRMAGIQISSTEGSPDAEMKVRIRGGGSITGDNAPLYIVDGFPVASIADIAPSDIETIDVLKDASSAAIYGSRGANGVILVTTKGAKSGKTAVSYAAYGGFRNIANTLDVLTPADYVKWQYENALLNNDLGGYTKYFGNYQDIDLYDQVKANDWQDLVFGRTGNVFNQNISLSGGSDNTKYTLSHTFIKDKAIMEMSGYQRQNLNFKLNHKPHKRVTVDLGMRFSDTKIEGGGTNEQKEISSADSRLKYAMLYPPFAIQGLTNTDETDDEFNLYNPLEALSDNDQLQKRRTYNLNGSVAWELVDNLKIKSEIGYDDFRNADDRFYGKTTYYVANIPAAENQGLPAIVFTKLNKQSLRNTNTLTYDFKDMMGTHHNLNLLLGQEYIKSISESHTTTVHGFPKTFGFDDARKLSAQGDANAIENYLFPDDKLLSFFGRSNYDFKGKYLLSATFRADGSSKFSKNNRWGYFPSASGAWRISAEPFMDNTKRWLDDLKLRASYGTAGNNNIPSGQMTQTFDVKPTTWVNGFESYWAASKIMANSDLKWETTVTRNLGLDYSLFGGAVTGTIDAYLNHTKDLLILFPIPGTGYDGQYRNMGETQNKGLELSMAWKAIQKKNIDLNLSANISFNRNKVNSLGLMESFYAESQWASSEIGPEYIVQQGLSVGKMYGYLNDGRYEVSDFSGYDATTKKWILKDGVADATAVVGALRPGMIKLKNIAGEGNRVDATDRTIIGDANPSHTGGFSIYSRIYNFDISALFNWSYGNDIYNANKIEYTSTSKYSSRNMISTMAEGQRWTNLLPDGTLSNDPNQLEEMNRNTTMWSPHMKSFVFSDWAVEDGSFLRFSTLSVGYTLPNQWLKKASVKNLRLYVTGYNLFTWTNYSGFDPEVSTRRKTNLTPGVDYSAYPKSRLFVAGINLNF
ncbi:MAG TPA: TonB-dependent receptor [Sphingobacterium sp.]|jgi:TonB-linked SusC/RagA family outer membrane protein|uniref:SusC/RagA family TonB-linked outer membrane protein n=1 Tax=Sphingobacterium faecium TaxID=34087 RepID=UPI000B9C0D4C|nr:TonB-dependent receptor [Sphingobacterium faecium]UXD68965.1 TonB-dependent receptor [Sphingobacterium faecium]HCU45063.1 TonB-dependent receptor [Sphingobacterium sp.]